MIVLWSERTPRISHVLGSHLIHSGFSFSLCEEVAFRNGEAPMGCFIGRVQILWALSYPLNFGWFTQWFIRTWFLVHWICPYMHLLERCPKSVSMIEKRSLTLPARFHVVAHPQQFLIEFLKDIHAELVVMLRSYYTSPKSLSITIGKKC